MHVMLVASLSFSWAQIPVLPSASVKSGLCKEGFTVVVSSEAPDVSIRYTLDWSLPSASHWVVYEQPIPMTSTSIVSATAAIQTLLLSYLIVDQVAQTLDSRAFPDISIAEVALRVLALAHCHRKSKRFVCPS